LLFVAQGGCIYQQAGTINVSNSQFSNNNANAAGGFFIGIPPTTEAFAQGGVLYQAGGVSNFSNCAFQDNRTYAILESLGMAASQGGAIYELAGAMSLKNCTFQDNQTVAFLRYVAGLTVAQGGALYQAGGAMNISKTAFVDNALIPGIIGSPTQLAQGGAIYVGGGSLTVENCSFDGNYFLGESPDFQVINVPDAIYVTAGTVSISKNSTLDGLNVYYGDPEITGTFAIY
jgi:hypothetical protein